ncbi:hypothetical protein BU25DRAFT_76882 [Macroventuria anomochaeta]|uniref:Uncharacterized protein n=1 Tax=Macroventuria anomochaeta TaxID=301207 RepID=A0ACB6SE17_9PLEO|nr:uncharacterized protein BU25DRAFT_76882 [Macroventuria anomochaeta]KAF2632556.1 hypothetical protein BU25DRAFT_76882 [Macroventuria anomochaeta]
MTTRLSNISIDFFLMLLITTINVINICVSLLAALQIRGLRNQTQKQVRKQIKRQVRKQAHKSARRSRRQYIDVSTQTIQIPSSPDSRRSLQATHNRLLDSSLSQHAAETGVDGTANTTGAFSSTGYYPSSQCSTYSSAPPSSHSSIVELEALANMSGEMLVNRLSRTANSSGTTLVEVLSSDSDRTMSRSRGRRRRYSGQT